MITLEYARDMLCSLVVFRKLRLDPVIEAFYKVALCKGQKGYAVHERALLISRFSAALLDTGESFSAYILSRLLLDDNAYIRKRAFQGAADEQLEHSARLELKALGKIGRMTTAQVQDELECSFFIHPWRCEELDYSKAYEDYAARAGKTGWGMFSIYHMFLMDDKGCLLPVAQGDPITLSRLTGYERERQAVIDNTRALLSGQPALNVLLYGDSGTGKSASVKAVANEFKNDGLRLIELRRDQISQIPRLMAELCTNPLKFIIFIDDLSFGENSESFSPLKAILEGGVSVRARNTVIYATSNRRHLVKESQSTREGDDVHLRDTLEEVSSLSERFGLTVTFLRPDRALYLDIVKNYCIACCLDFNAETADKAELFALKSGGRNARTARHFVENLSSMTRE